MEKTKADFLKIKSLKEYKAQRESFMHLPVDEEIKAHISFLYKDYHSYVEDLETFEQRDFEFK